MTHPITWLAWTHRIALATAVAGLAGAAPAQTADPLAAAQTAETRLEFAAAYDLLAQAIEADPAAAEPYLLRARIHRKLHRPALALQDLQRAREAGAPGAAPELISGEILLENDAPYPAVSAFDAALERTPDDLAALLGRARANSRVGLLGNAIADYDRAMDLAPTDASIRAERDALDTSLEVRRVASITYDADALMAPDYRIEIGDADAPAHLVVIEAGNDLAAESEALDLGAVDRAVDAGTLHVTRLFTYTGENSAIWANLALICGGAEAYGELRAAFTSDAGQTAFTEIDAAGNLEPLRGLVAEAYDAAGIAPETLDNCAFSRVRAVRYLADWSEKHDGFAWKGVDFYDTWPVYVWDGTPRPVATVNRQLSVLAPPPAGSETDTPESAPEMASPPPATEPVERTEPPVMAETDAAPEADTPGADAVQPASPSAESPEPPETVATDAPAAAVTPESTAPVFDAPEGEDSAAAEAEPPSDEGVSPPDAASSDTPPDATAEADAAVTPDSTAPASDAPAGEDIAAAGAEPSSDEAVSPPETAPADTAPKAAAEADAETSPDPATTPTEPMSDPAPPAEAAPEANLAADIAPDADAETSGIAAVAPPEAASDTAPPDSPETTAAPAESPAPRPSPAPEPAPEAETPPTLVPRAPVTAEGSVPAVLRGIYAPSLVDCLAYTDRVTTAETLDALLPGLNPLDGPPVGTVLLTSRRIQLFNATGTECGLAEVTDATGDAPWQASLTCANGLAPDVSTALRLTRLEANGPAPRLAADLGPAERVELLQCLPLGRLGQIAAPLWDLDTDACLARAPVTRAQFNFVARDDGGLDLLLRPETPPADAPETEPRLVLDGVPWETAPPDWTDGAWRFALGPFDEASDRLALGLFLETVGPEPGMTSRLPLLGSSATMQGLADCAPAQEDAAQ